MEPPWKSARCTENSLARLRAREPLRYIIFSSLRLQHVVKAG